jgi:sugar lactone lactonase YvrE
MSILVFLASFLLSCSVQQSRPELLPVKPSGLRFAGEISGEFAGRTLRAPEAVAFDPAGNLYIVDTGNDRIVKLDPDLRFLTSNGGFGAGSGFNRPVDIATADGIDFFVLDQANRRLVKLDYNLIADEEIDFTDQTELMSMGEATAVGVATDGRIYLLDPDNLRVMVLDTEYEVESELAASGGFVGCAAISFGPDQRTYVYDNREQVIFVFDVFGNNLNRVELPEIGELGGFTTTSYYFVATDRQRHELVIYSLAGKHLTSIGRHGSGSYHFDSPGGVALRHDGRLFVADTGNNRIVYYELVAE